MTVPDYPLIPPAVLRRWQLARSGFTHDVANGYWQKGPVALNDEAIDGADEDLWALLMGEWDPSACEGIYYGPVVRTQDRLRPVRATVQV